MSDDYKELSSVLLEALEHNSKALRAARSELLYWVVTNSASYRKNSDVFNSIRTALAMNREILTKARAVL